MNRHAEEALGTLEREANRVEDKTTRKKAMKKISELRDMFEKMEGMKAANPPGKAVLRDPSGKVIGLQG